MYTHTIKYESSQDWRFKSSRAHDLTGSDLGVLSNTTVTSEPAEGVFQRGEQLPQRGSAGWFYSQNLTHPRAAEAGLEAQWMRPLRTI